MRRALQEASAMRKYDRDPMQVWAAGESKSQMMREVYSCWENPERIIDGGDDESFHVWVPISAGLDSTAALAMAVAAGLPVWPVYVDTGAEYSDVEYRTAQSLLEQLTGDSHVHRYSMPVEYKKWQHVDAARNLVIVWLLAEKLSNAGGWGELWFGNTAEWQETPVRGGDKCARFFADAQALLYLAGGHDMRIVNPVGALTKADCVTYLASHGQLELALRSRSCYDGRSERGCGECRSCFRRYVAFLVAGYGDEVVRTFDTLRFASHVRQFAQARRERFDCTMSAGRTERVAKALVQAGMMKENEL